MTFYERAYPSDYLRWALEKLKEGVFSANDLLSDQLVEDYVTSSLPKQLPACHPFALGGFAMREGILEFLYGEDGEEPITELDDISRSKRVKEYLDSLFFQDGFCPECALEVPIYFGGTILYEDILNWCNWSPGARLVFLLLIEIFYLGELDEGEDAFPGDLSLSETLARSLGPYVDWWGSSERYEPEDMLQNPLLSEIEFHTALVSGVENNPFIGYLARDGECVSDILTVSAVDFQEMSQLMALADIASQLANHGFTEDMKEFPAGELFRTVSQYLVCEDKMERMVITFAEGNLPTVEVVSKGVHAKKAVSIAALLGAMVAEASLPPIWVEDNLIATNGLDQNSFFIPPHRRDLLIDDLYINDVPIPGLIVALKGENNKVAGVLLFAVTEKRKEDLKISSSLYKMPFPNTYDSGAVCWGDSSVSQYGERDWQGVLTEFFSSRFNGDLIKKASKAHPDDIREMLIELTGKEEYPVDDLVPSSSFASLSELLERGGAR